MRNKRLNESNSSSQNKDKSKGMTKKKAKNFYGTLIRLLTYLKPRKIRLIIVGLLAILSTVFSIVSPKIMGNVTTKIYEGFMMKIRGVADAQIDFNYVFNVLGLLALLYFISFAFSYIMQYMMADIAQKTVYDMRRDVSQKLERLPLSYYDTHKHGEILSRITNDMDNISTTLQQSITQLITAVITLFGVLVIMLTISPMMTLIASITLPISIILTPIITKRSQKYFKNQQKKLGELNSHVEEMYTGHKVVKIFRYEKQSVEKFDAINKELYEVGWKAQFMSGLIMPLMNFVNKFGYVIVSVGGGLFVTKRAITIGEVQALIQYSRQLSQPILQTASIANIIQSTIASAERVFEVLDELEEISDPSPSKTIEKPRGDIVFNHVTFGYKEDAVLINDMSIHIESGQTVAIVGPTGAGKTTLMNLLMRFYDVNKGSITVDGVNIKDFKRGDLRSMFGMVLQDTWLFKGSIRDNIAYGSSNATDEEVFEAAQGAFADHFIRTLPDGYDTIINEEADNISQGQKQLITIARAILANPAILILDEATSSIDTRTELYIQKAMANLMKGRTSFVIAHRLSTIKDADVILVMNDGNIIEQGNHETLMTKNSFYSSLYNSQFVGNTIQKEVV